jgi:hypothetical protein
MKLAIQQKSNERESQSRSTYAAKSISALQNIRDPRFVVSTRKTHFSLLVSFATGALTVIGPLKHIEISVVTSRKIGRTVPSESHSCTRHLKKCESKQIGNRHFILMHSKRRITISRSR